MNYLDLTLAITAIANAIAQEFTSSEVALISCVFVQLGDTLATIMAAQDLSDASEGENNKGLASQLNPTKSE